MNVLLIDGHPDAGRLTSHLLDIYQAALPDDTMVSRIAVRDLAFDPILHHGYAKRTEWEPDLHRFAALLDACDHIVIAFPMWWGSEPAQLKGLIDRVFLPGFTFAYHDNDQWWDKLMQGRSADVIATMDTPRVFLRLMYGNAIIKRWKGQILGFCGFKPVRFLAMAPVKKGEADKRLPKWKSRIEKLARSIRCEEPKRKQLRLDRFMRR
jgi:NAD(P)H dehydrogenase (quinone)